MTITINGETVDLEAPLSVADLLRARGRDPGTPGVAVAINGEVLAAQRWEAVGVQDGDRVDVVVAVGGG